MSRFKSHGSCNCAFNPVNSTQNSQSFLFNRLEDAATPKIIKNQGYSKTTSNSLEKNSKSEQQLKITETQLNLVLKELKQIKENSAKNIKNLEKEIEEQRKINHKKDLRIKELNEIVNNLNGELSSREKQDNLTSKEKIEKNQECDMLIKDLKAKEREENTLKHEINSLNKELEKLKTHESYTNSPSRSSTKEFLFDASPSCSPRKHVNESLEHLYVLEIRKLKLEIEKLKREQEESSSVIYIEKALTKRMKVEIEDLCGILEEKNQEIGKLVKIISEIEGKIEDLNYFSDTPNRIKEQSSISSEKFPLSKIRKTYSPTKIAILSELDSVYNKIKLIKLENSEIPKMQREIEMLNSELEQLQESEKHYIKCIEQERAKALLASSPRSKNEDFYNEKKMRLVEIENKKLKDMIEILQKRLSELQSHEENFLINLAGTNRLYRAKKREDEEIRYKVERESDKAKDEFKGKNFELQQSIEN